MVIAEYTVFMIPYPEINGKKKLIPNSLDKKVEGVPRNMTVGEKF